MPAQSKDQLNLMRLVRGVQSGNVPKSKVSAKVKDMAKSMDPEDVKDYAKTSDKGLPQKVSQEQSQPKSGQTDLENDPSLYINSPDKLVKKEVNESNPALNKQVKQFLDSKMNNLPKGRPNHLWAVMQVLTSALIDANFHSQAKNVAKLFPTANWGDPSEENEFAKVYAKFGRQIAEMAGWDGGDIVDAIGFYVSMTIGRPLGQKIEKLVETKITEEEDCGCGTTEQNIHTSNKLTLKTAMQEGEESEPEIKVGTIVQAYGFPMVAGFKGENFYKIVGIDGDKVIFRRSNELGDTTNVGLKTYEVSMKAVKDAIKSVEGGGTSGLQIWDGGANLDEASNILVNDVNPDAVEAFLRKYPKIRTVILSIARKTKDLRKGYATFLKFKDKHENELGGRPEKVGSPTFGEKTFYKYDWMGTKGWAEVYQYLDGIKEGKIRESLRLTSLLKK